MYDVIGALRGCHAVLFDSCNNLWSFCAFNHSVVCQFEYSTKRIIYWFGWFLFLVRSSQSFDGSIVV